MTIKPDNFSPGVLEWYQQKITQPRKPSNESQSKILQAYSNYLLKGAILSKRQ